MGGGLVPVERERFTCSLAREMQAWDVRVHCPQTSLQPCASRTGVVRSFTHAWLALHTGVVLSQASKSGHYYFAPLAITIAALQFMEALPRLKSRGLDHA